MEVDVSDMAPVAPPEPKVTWRPPAKKSAESAPPTTPAHDVPKKERSIPLWVIGLVFVVLGVAAGALTAYLAN